MLMYVIVTCFSVGGMSGESLPSFVGLDMVKSLRSSSSSLFWSPLCLYMSTHAFKTSALWGIGLF